MAQKHKTMLAALAGGMLLLAASWPATYAQDWARLRAEMVERTLAHPPDIRPPVRDPRVLAAMGKVPRHEFVPAQSARYAYRDTPLPIGHDQTISQPYMVAKMTELALLKPTHRILEVGTGSGYQAAVLAELVREVYTIEIVPALAQQAEERLQRLGYKNVHVRAGDGYLGWPEAAPFDAVVVTAGATHLPRPLLEQLRPGGRMVIPVGKPPRNLVLEIIHRGKTADDIRIERIMPVAFVPLTGEYAQPKD